METLFYLTRIDNPKDTCSDLFWIVDYNRFDGAMIARSLASLYYYGSGGWSIPVDEWNSGVDFSLWIEKDSIREHVANYKIELTWNPEFAAWELE